VWIPLTLAFLLPFARVRGVRLDLAVLAAFGISVAFFNAADVDTSVPLVYPLLAYLLARALWLGLRRREEGRSRGPMPLLVPASVLGVAVVFLLGFRVGLNVTSSNVIDVGYAGVIGADKLVAGEPLYGTFPEGQRARRHLRARDLRGLRPVGRALGWSGRWDATCRRRTARRSRSTCSAARCCSSSAGGCAGPTLGIVLAYLWAAFPFSLYVLMSNSNDALVTVFVLLRRPRGRQRAGARRGDRARRADEVRDARARARCSPPTRGPTRARRGAFGASFALVAAWRWRPCSCRARPLGTVLRPDSLGFQGRARLAVQRLGALADSTGSKRVGRA
jgi:hypothetical protein